MFYAVSKTTSIFAQGINTRPAFHQLSILQRPGYKTSETSFCDALEELDALRKHEGGNGDLCNWSQSWLRNDLFRSVNLAIKQVLNNAEFFDRYTLPSYDDVEE